MDFKNIEIKDEKEIPASMSVGKYDYQPLIDAAKKLQPEKAMKVPITKDHHVQSIRAALGRYDKSRKYRVSMRKIDGKKFAIVVLADGYK